MNDNSNPKADDAAENIYDVEEHIGEQTDPAQGFGDVPVEPMTEEAPVEVDAAMPNETGSAEQAESADEDPLDDAQEPASENSAVIPSDADIASEEPEPVVTVMQPSKQKRFRAAWRAFWNNKPLRYGVLGGLVVLIGVIAFVQPVRTFALNLVGMRATVSVTVLDSSTTIPLKNAHLVVASKDVKTDENGYAKITGLKLGTAKITIHKEGFADSVRTQYLGLRITALGDISLKATGTQYTFKLTDYFSGQAVANTMLTSGEATTTSDKNGKAILTIAPGADETTETAVTAKGYRTETVKLPSDATQPINVVLVPAAKEVFVSKQSGTYDLYKMDFDGKNKQVLLAGTGRETSTIASLVDPLSKRVALVSTRDDVRNSDGYLESALTIVDIETGDSETIDHSENIQLVGWHGTTIVYTMTAAGASAANGNRQKLIAYDYTTTKRVQLAGANYFSGTVLRGETVYYIVSSTDPSVPGSFNRVNLDASGKKTIATNNLWAMYRQSYKSLYLQGASAWYQYNFGDSEVSTTNPPSSYDSRQYLDTTDGKKSAWVDTRDANGVLTIYDVASGKDSELTTARGLREIVRWVNDDVVVYRVYDQGVTTEHAVSISGGSSKALTEVSLTY